MQQVQGQSREKPLKFLDFILGIVYAIYSNELHVEVHTFHEERQDREVLEFILVLLPRRQRKVHEEQRCFRGFVFGIRRY